MFGRIEEIRDHLARFVEARVDLFKLEVQENIENAILRLASLFLMGLLAGIALVFLLLLVAVFLNHYLNSYYAGYLLVLGFDFLLLVICYWQKERLAHYIRRFLRR